MHAEWNPVGGCGLLGLSNKGSGGNRVHDVIVKGVWPATLMHTEWDAVCGYMIFSTSTKGVGSRVCCLHLIDTGG